MLETCPCRAGRRDPRGCSGGLRLPGRRTATCCSPEQILANDRTAERGVFRYQVFGYTNYAKLVTDLAIGEFVMTPAGPDRRQTHVTWTYSFHHRSGITGRFLDGFVAGTWAPYMHTVLQGMKAAAERTR